MPVLLASTDAGLTSPMSAVIIVMVIVVTVIGLVFRRLQGPQDPLELVFRGAPMADAVVTSRELRHPEGGEESKGGSLYTISYRVSTPDDLEFDGWEEKRLTADDGALAFAVGTHHRVAYRLGSDQVRAHTRRRRR